MSSAILLGPFNRSFGLWWRCVESQRKPPLESLFTTTKPDRWHHCCKRETLILVTPRPTEAGPASDVNTAVNSGVSSRAHRAAMLLFSSINIAGGRVAVRFHAARFSGGADNTENCTETKATVADCGHKSARGPEKITPKFGQRGAQSSVRVCSSLDSCRLNLQLFKSRRFGVFLRRCS